MSKIDQNDLIYFKEACDKTYTSSRSKDSDNIIQQTVDGKDIFPKTKAEAVIMSDGKTFEELVQSGSLNPITRASDMTISGTTNITSTGTYQFGLAFSPNNYNVDINSVQVTSDCSEITISNITTSGFTMNVNSIPSATDHKLTIVVEDKLDALFTKELVFTVKVEPTALTISGSTEVDNETSNNYTIGYTPSTYNVAPASVEITSNQASVVVSNKTKTGFALTPNCEESLTATITVKATMPSGNMITNTINITINCGPDYTILDENGVAIMDINGKFYKNKIAWLVAGSPTPNGIAISDGIHRFCIAKEKTQSVCANGTYPDQEYWGGYGKSISGATKAGTSSEANFDYAGEANTVAIISKITSTNGKFNKSPWSAAGVCRQYTFPNGAKGYLGACGEWKKISNLNSKIDELLTDIGGDKIYSGKSYTNYWTSTQEDENYAWVWMMSANTCSSGSKNGTALIRALCAI